MILITAKLDTYSWIFIQRHSIAKNVGCFQWRLFVYGFVCQHDNFQKSKHRMMKLAGYVHCTKISAEFELGHRPPLSAHSLGYESHYSDCQSRRLISTSVSLLQSMSVIQPIIIIILLFVGHNNTNIVTVV